MAGGAHELGEKLDRHLAMPVEAASTVADELAAVIGQAGGNANLGFVHGVRLAGHGDAGPGRWAGAQGFATVIP